VPVPEPGHQQGPEPGHQQGPGPGHQQALACRPVSASMPEQVLRRAPVSEPGPA
jgi:hypothetical protein